MNPIYTPKTNRCILFLQFVTNNYTYSPGGNEWTGKDGRRAYTLYEIYKDFNKKYKRKTD